MFSRAVKALVFSTSVKAVDNSIWRLYFIPETPVAEITLPFSTLAEREVLLIASSRKESVTY